MREIGVDSRVLDGYCCFYWLGHFEGFVAWDFHLVDFLGVQLDVSDDLVVCLCSNHEAAVTVYLFRHFSSSRDALMFLIRCGGLRTRVDCRCTYESPSHKLFPVAPSRASGNAYPKAD